MCGFSCYVFYAFLRCTCIESQRWSSILIPSVMEAFLCAYDFLALYPTLDLYDSSRVWNYLWFTISTIYVVFLKVFYALHEMLPHLILIVDASNAQHC